MFESNLAGICGVSMLINLFLGFVIYFMRTNQSYLQTSLKHAYEQSLYAKTCDMLGLLHKSAKRITRTIEDEELRDEFNHGLGGISQERVDLSSNKKKLIESGQYIALKYLQLFTKGNTLLCAECHEEVIKNYFEFVSHLNEDSSDAAVIIAVIGDKYDLLTQKENACREVVKNIE